MLQSNSLQRALHHALCVGAAASAALPVTVSAGDDQEQITEVIVTGSRIAAPNLESTSPIQVVTSKEIQQGGKTDVVDFVNQLPQSFQNSTTDFSNTSNGLATPGGITTANLRGLGIQRTLVLVNGRRLGTGDPNTANPNSSPDLDQIPAAMIERVEVVTGGASAVYGSDAIAGVVNFILKKNFEGVQIDGQIGEYFHDNSNDYIQSLQTGDFDRVSGSTHDGRSTNFNILLGSNIADGAGNVTAYMGYMKSDPVASADRDFGGCQLNLNTTKTGVRCAGSANSNFFSTADGSAYTVAGDQFMPWPQSGTSPPAEFNSQPYIYMSRANQRYLGGFMAHVDVNDHVKPYAELGFMNDKTDITVAPSGLFQQNPFDPTGNGNFNINCSNPLLSAQQRATICTPQQIIDDTANPGSASANINIGRRNIEGGGRENFWEHTNYRAVVGATGDIGNAWQYDAYGQYYYTTMFNSNEKYLSYAAVNDALQVTGTAADPVCISGAGSCVPWNIFTEGAVTPAQVDSLYTSGTSRGSVTQRTIHADVTGDLGEYGIKFPGAADGIAVNVGFEHRNERLSFKPDAAELSGDISGLGGASVAIDNSDSVKEGFVELRAPLLQDRPGVKDLVVDAGYRRSDYELAGGINTYKFEVQYAPVVDVRFRGSYQHAIRAPNIIELFTPQAFAFGDTVGIDPCAPTRVGNDLVPATASLADCLRTGVTEAQYGDGSTTNTIKQCVAGQCAELKGGNTELKPEEADSITLGLTFAPSFLPNLTASVDYYRIKLENVVDVLRASTIMQECLSTGSSLYCSQIVRTSAGSIYGSSVETGGYIMQVNRNVAAREVRGIDLQANYKLDLPGSLGSLMFALAGTNLLKDAKTPYPDAHTYDCAGLYGKTCQTLNPHWRHNLRVSWVLPSDVEISAYWRYIGAVKLDSNTSDQTLSDGSYNAFDAEIGAQNYFDLAASWDVVEYLQLRAGINNIVDKDPPLVSSTVSGTGLPNTYPTYDMLGRQVFAAFTAKF